jgi:hypothetical protein
VEFTSLGLRGCEVPVGGEPAESWIMDIVLRSRAPVKGLPDRG